MKKIVIYFLMLFLVNIAFGQRSERIGYVNMEYILSQMEDYKTASAQLEEKVNKWKSEIELKKNEIKKLKDSLELERPLLSESIINYRQSEIEFEEKSLYDYQTKRFGVNGDWVAQEYMLIQPIQDKVLNVVEAISKQKKFDKIFDESADAIMFYSEKKYDISDLVLKSILRNEKIEELEIEIEQLKKQLNKTQRIQEVNKKRELLLKQRDEKRKAYLKRRDSILKLRKEKKQSKKS